jgi:hypothetical protein
MLLFSKFHKDSSLSIPNAKYASNTNALLKSTL